MREHFLNADFDASLTGRPSLLGTDDPTYLHEMAWHFLFAAGPEDSVILHAPLPAAFRGYLEAKGLPPPRTVLHPDFTPAAVQLTRVRPPPDPAPAANPAPLTAP